MDIIQLAFFIGRFLNLSEKSILLILKLTSQEKPESNGIIIGFANPIVLVLNFDD